MADRLYVLRHEAAQKASVPVFRGVITVFGILADISIDSGSSFI